MSIEENHRGHRISALDRAVWFAQEMDGSGKPFLQHTHFVDMLGTVDLTLFRTTWGQAFQEGDALSVRLFDDEIRGGPGQVVEMFCPCSFVIVNETGKEHPGKIRS